MSFPGTKKMANPNSFDIPVVDFNSTEGAYITAVPGQTFKFFMLCIK